MALLPLSHGWTGEVEAAQMNASPSLISGEEHVWVWTAVAYLEPSAGLPLPSTGLGHSPTGSLVPWG